MPEGTVKKLTKLGYGFLDIGTERDMFFHSSKVEGVAFEQLQEGQKVSCTVGRSPKGPCAESVKVV
jgi:CspA family cold shock protein